MIDINELRRVAENDDNVFITQHMLSRQGLRKIQYDDIISAIRSGEIIEQYPSDYPHPSCLVLGIDTDNEYLHVVCGLSGEYLWIITAYYPDEDKWNSDFKTRKEYNE